MLVWELFSINYKKHFQVTNRGIAGDFITLGYRDLSGLFNWQKITAISKKPF
jgi:hypothetical protein